jgi:hypothetical protein
MNAIAPQTVVTPHACLLIPVDPQRHRVMRPLQGDLSQALAAKKAKREQWAALDLNEDTRLRQQWADEGWMRDHLKAAGLVVRNSAEPATVPRLKSLLRRLGVNGPEIMESVGKDLAGFLTMNPRLPLWAALALVLELTGRFAPTSAT